LTQAWQIPDFAEGLHFPSAPEAGPASHTHSPPSSASAAAAAAADGSSLGKTAGPSRDDFLLFSEKIDNRICTGIAALPRSVCLSPSPFFVV